MKMIVPLILALIGIGGGIGAGLVLKPEVHAENCPAPKPDAEDNHALAEQERHENTPDVAHNREENGRDYAKLSNQFVVPVVRNERVTAMVVMSLSVEVKPGRTEIVYKREPKLRDMFLQALFDHANVGGFEGAFTNSDNLDVLRRMLLNTARHELGDIITDVLITEIARQDI